MYFNLLRDHLISYFILIFYLICFCIYIYIYIYISIGHLVLTTELKTYTVCMATVKSVKADVSSVSSSSERLEELWVVCGFICRQWSYAIGGNVVTRKQELIS